MNNKFIQNILKNESFPVVWKSLEAMLLIVSDQFLSIKKYTGVNFFAFFGPPVETIGKKWTFFLLKYSVGVKSNIRQIVI